MSTTPSLSAVGPGPLPRAAIIAPKPELTETLFDGRLTNFAIGIMWSHMAIKRLDPLMVKAFELLDETPKKAGNPSDKGVDQIVLTYTHKAIKFKGRRMEKVRPIGFEGHYEKDY